jgi:hypothetical protein
MKNTAITLLIIALAGLTAFCIRQQTQIGQLQSQVAESKTQLVQAKTDLQTETEAVEQAKFSEQKAKALQQTLNEAAAHASAQAQQVTQLQQSLQTARTNDPAKSYMGMFRDPKMREMIKSQQKMVMGPMVDKIYAGLFDKLKLSADQTAGLKDLVVKKMLAQADLGMSLMAESDPDKRKELQQQIKEKDDASNGQIKDLLGDENYPTFQTYEKSMSDRMSVDMFRDQLASTSMPLDPALEDQLVQAMYEERTHFKWTTDFSDRKNTDRLADLGDPQKVDQYIQEKAQFDQQLLDKVATLLTPEQLEKFKDFQKTQTQMQMAQLKMAGQMFGGKK